MGEMGESIVILASWEKHLYQGRQESLTISTYFISIVGSQVYILVQKQRETERERGREKVACL